MKYLRQIFIWLCLHPATVLALCSLTIIITVYSMQYIGGLSPCELCINQRYPYFGILVISTLAIFTSKKIYAILISLCGVGFIVSIGFAIDHFGIENGWWTSSCVIKIENTTSISDLKKLINSAPMTRCDEVAWSLLGMSLSGWNIIISAMLVIFAFYCSVKMLFSEVFRKNYNGKR